MKRLFRRPSPAMAVAIAALIAALGGTAVASGVLNKKKVNRIITNRAPGLSVSHAKSADTATSATSAGTASLAADANAVDGMTVRKIFYAPTASTATPTTILSLGGLSLDATCAGGTVAIAIKSAVDHAHFTSQMWNTAGSDGLRHTDFNTTTNDDLTDGNLWGETSFTYTQPNGTIVVGEVSFDSDNVIGGNILNHSAKCLVSGVATSTASS